jgi:hypothetical protein
MRSTQFGRTTIPNARSTKGAKRKQMIATLTCIRLRKSTIGIIGHKQEIAMITLFRRLARYHSAVPAFFLSAIYRDVTTLRANLPG